MPGTCYSDRTETMHVGDLLGRAGSPFLVQEQLFAGQLFTLKNRVPLKLYTIKKYEKKMLFDQKLAVFVAKSCDLLTISRVFLPVGGKKPGFNDKLGLRRRTKRKVASAVISDRFPDKQIKKNRQKQNRNSYLSSL